MILRVFFLLIGFGIAVAGGISIIAFLNLIATGVTFGEYLDFMSQRVETYLFFSGIVIIWLSIYFPTFK